MRRQLAATSLAISLTLTHLVCSLIQPREGSSRGDVNGGGKEPRVFAAEGGGPGVAILAVFHVVAADLDALGRVDQLAGGDGDVEVVRVGRGGRSAVSAAAAVS